MIIIACFLVFVLFIAPKFLGTQILPFDPFGFSDSTEVAGEEATTDDDKYMEDTIYSEDQIEIENVTISIKELGEADENDSFIVYKNEIYHLEVNIHPQEARPYANMEWSIIGDSEKAFIDGDGVFVPSNIGEVFIKVIVSVKNGKVVSSFVRILIEDTTPEDDSWPFAGAIIITNEPKLGIFIRSDHFVDGDSNLIDDGNKIGWIAGGDTSVELIATGNKYHEGGDGFWWYEVKIPQWYRDTGKQKNFYDGRTLIGWVREDVLMEKP